MDMLQTQFDEDDETTGYDGQLGRKGGRISDMETKSIMVRVGSPVKKYSETALRSSVFNKGMVKESNKQRLKPIQKYAYDKSGSLINQHRQKKDMTVATRINKHNWELSRQIEHQRDYLIQVLRGRLQSEYATSNNEIYSDDELMHRLNTAAGIRQDHSGIGVPESM